MSKQLTMQTEEEPQLFKIAYKTSEIVNSMPYIDGHFWIERDGKIIDPHFPEHDYIKRVHRGVKFVYKPADVNTQVLMMAMHFRTIEKGGYENTDDFLIDYKLIGGEEAQHGFCFFNALMEQKKGDKIIFGSWGVERADGTKFWEYGGEDWTGVKAFIKRR